MAIVMELMDGGMFIDFLMNGPIEETVVKYYFHQFIDALEYIHS